jgi:hypothetical protein
MEELVWTGEDPGEVGALLGRGRSYDTREAQADERGF